MKRIFPIIAIVLTVVNAVRKIMDKRQMITTLYSKNWGGMWGKKILEMKIPMETFIIGLMDGVLVAKKFVPSSFVLLRLVYNEFVLCDKFPGTGDVT